MSQATKYCGVTIDRGVLRARVTVNGRCESIYKYLYPWERRAVAYSRSTRTPAILGYLRDKVAKRLNLPVRNWNYPPEELVEDAAELDAYAELDRLCMPIIERYSRGKGPSDIVCFGKLSRDNPTTTFRRRGPRGPYGKRDGALNRKAK